MVVTPKEVAMPEFLAAGVLVFMLVLIFGMLSGRVRLQSGCCPVDPRDDPRMRQDPRFRR